MASELLVNKITPESGTTLTLGESGDTISLPSGVSLDTLTITGDLTVDTNTLYVDSSNNRVGIGTSSPESSLTVSGALLATPTVDGVHLGISSNYASIELCGGSAAGSLIDFTESGTDYKGRILYNNSSDYMSFSTNSTEKMRIDSSGNVGVNTSSPLGVFDVAGSGSPNNDNWIYLRGGNVGAPNNPSASFSSGIAIGSNYSNGNSDTNIVWGQGVGSQQFLSISKWDGSAVTEQMRIDSSGNVGIGTSSPDAFLEINGLGRFLSKSGSYPAAGKGVELYYESVGDIAVVQSYDRGGSAWKPIQVGGSDVRFISSGTEAMRIDSSGNLSLGTTTADSNVRFNVERKGGAGNEMNIGFTSSGTIKWRIGSVATDAFAVYNAANTGMYMSNGATSWTATSDERLKNITSIIENALDAISTLRAVKFTWISDENNVPQVGLIAQDVQQVLPEVISEDTEGYLGVRYTETIPLLVAAIQELKADNDALRARIEALENA